MEVEHTARNVYLQAESLGLGAVVIGAFGYDEEVKHILHMDVQGKQLYLMPLISQLHVCHCRLSDEVMSLPLRLLL